MVNKTELFENFKDIKNFVNFNYLVCHKNLFTNKGILSDIGSYLILTIMLFHLINIFILSLIK